MPIIASTLSSDQKYTGYHDTITSGSKVARPAVVTKQVLVKGRANVRNKLTTPQGVITSVSDEDLAFLQTNKEFLAHQERGHVKVLKSEPHPDKVAKGMTARDESAPLSIEHGDFEKGGRAAGVKPTLTSVE